MTRGNLRAIVSRRYKGTIAEKVISKFGELRDPQELNEYVDLIENLLNFDKTDRLMRIAFEVYDFTQDKLICELDTYTNIQNFSDDDEVFVSAFSYDLCLIGEALEAKRRSLGVKNLDQHYKMQMI